MGTWPRPGGASQCPSRPLGRDLGAQCLLRAPSSPGTQTSTSPGDVESDPHAQSRPKRGSRPGSWSADPLRRLRCRLLSLGPRSRHGCLQGDPALTLGHVVTRTGPLCRPTRPRCSVGSLFRSTARGVSPHTHRLADNSINADKTVLAPQSGLAPLSYAAVPRGPPGAAQARTPWGPRPPSPAVTVPPFSLAWLPTLLPAPVGCWPWSSCGPSSGWK